MTTDVKNIPRIGAVVSKVTIIDSEHGCWADIEFVDGDSKISPFKGSKLMDTEGRLGYIDSKDRKRVSVHVMKERTKQEYASLQKFVSPTEPFEIEDYGIKTTSSKAKAKKK